MPDAPGLNLDQVEARAKKALRTPDLEWAYDLVHGLADDSLALIATLRSCQEEASRLREALVKACHWHEQLDYDEALIVIDAALGREAG